MIRRLRRQHRRHLATAAQQKQDIAGFKRAPLADEPRLCVNQRLDMIRQFFGQRALFVAEPILFFVRAAILLPIGLGGYGFKEFNHADSRLIAIMRGDFTAYAKAFRPRFFDNGIDEIKDGRRRTEALRQGKSVQRRSRFTNPLGKIYARCCIAFGRGPLESVNGLLEIAYREQGSGLVGLHAHATVKIIAECADDIPLRGVGVLRLVDQYVINLPIKLKPHPIGHLTMLQQRGGAPDHVIKIHRAKRVFRLAILGRKFLAHQQSPRQPIGILRARDFAEQRVGPLEQL